jgi:hypothetical protein
MSVRNPRGRLTIAIAALGLLSVCLVVMGIGSGARALRRHIVVRVFNTNDYAQVFVNCRQAVAVLRAGDEATVDLGWLAPDDRVTLQARNGAGDSSWGFVVRVDGRDILRDVDGRVGGLRAGGAGALLREHLTHVRTLTAAGHDVGEVGCQDALPALAGARLTGDARFHATGGWLTWTAWLADRLRWVLVATGVGGLIWLYFTGRNAKTLWGLPLLGGWLLLQQQRFDLMFLLYGLGGALLLIYVGVSLLGWRFSRRRAPAAVAGSPHP